MHLVPTLRIEIILKNSKTTRTFKLNFQSSNNEEYNNPFNLDELKDAISKSHDTATGPYEIHYQMLKQLPLKSLQTLLVIFNNMWETEEFPESWELATIIPIPKPGKDHTEPKKYLFIYYEISVKHIYIHTYIQVITRR